MILCYVKWKWTRHFLLGKELGYGRQHVVYEKGKYVYKIRVKKTSNIIDFIKLIKKYYKRNTIPYQIPAKFVGIAYIDKHFYPIFKQLKLEPVTMSTNEFYSQIKELYKDCKLRISDRKPANFGMLNGELRAIDLYLVE